MRAESVAWERAAEVGEAAEGWRRAGAIDEATERAIRRIYPDPCVAPSIVWRVLMACVVAVVIVCAFGAFEVAFRPNKEGHQVLLFFFGAVALGAAEALETSPRFSRRGLAGATSFLGIVSLLIGFALFVLETVNMRFEDGLDWLLIAGVIAWGAGSWRWGSPIFAALSAVSFFLFTGRMTHGRLLWILAGAALAALASRRLDESTWAPVWAVLSLSGAALVVLALAVERRLRRAPGSEIAGLTADPFFSDERRRRAIEIIPVAAAFTATPGQAAEDKGIGGGRFGGGGAGEKF